MSNLISDVNVIKAMIEKGATVCPENVDPTTFNVLITAYGSKASAVEDCPFDVVTPAGQSNALVAQSSAPSTNLAMPANGESFSLDDFENSGSNVDGWLSVAAGVYKFAGNPISMPQSGIKCVLHGEATKIAQGIRCTNPRDPSDYQYHKTYNGRTTSDGLNWADVVSKCQKINDKAYVYFLAELELTTVDPIMDVSGKKIVAEAGTRIGFGNAPTGGKYVKAFNNELKAEGKTIMSPDVPCVLKPMLVQPRNGNPYPIITIEKR